MGIMFALKDSTGQVIKEFVAGINDRSYDLGGGRYLSVESTFAWCNECHAFVEAEVIGSIPQIDKEIARVRAGDLICLRFQRYSLEGKELPETIIEYPLKPEDRAAQDRELAELFDRRGWRLKRQSPPHCLECGSAQIDLVSDSLPMQNPKTGEMMEIVYSGHASLSSHDYFSAEGQLIR